MIDKNALKEILKLHGDWLKRVKGGKRADLSGADLRDADLSDADLRGADLRDAYLIRADLRDADLSDADLRDAYLRDAYLIRADLRGADLRYAYLSGADLSGADLSGVTKIISVSGVGSARRMTTYWINQDKVWCGCFTGTLAEFAKKIEETHAKNPVHLRDYRAVVAMLKVCAEGVQKT